MSADESLLTLAEAAKLHPARPHATALWRWCRKGVKARGGARIRLQHARFGRQLYTKVDWLDDFGRRLAEADVAHFAAPAPVYRVPRGRRSPEEVRQAVARANAELARDGI